MKVPSSIHADGPFVISAHFFGLMWFVNLCSPYINVLLNRPDVPNFIYGAIMGASILSLFVRKCGIAIRLPRLAVVAGLYLLYTVLLAITWGTRQKSWGFLVQGGSVILAMLIFRHPREYRIIMSWIAFGMAGYALFIIWQAITGYRPPWAIGWYVREIGGYIRGGFGFGEKNYSGALLLLGFIISWMMGVYRQIPRWSANIFMLGCLIGLFYTFSRGAFVALGIVLIFYALTSIRRLGWLVLAGIILTPIMIYFVGGALELVFYRFSIAGHDIQATSRWDQFIGGWDMFLSGSLVEILYGHGPFVLVNEIIIHNTPMGLLVEQGLIGLTLWVWLIASVARPSIEYYRCMNPYPMMALLGFLAAALLIRIEVERNFWLVLLLVHSIQILLNMPFEKNVNPRSRRVFNGRAMPAVSSLNSTENRG